MEIKITKIDSTPRSPYIKNNGSGSVTSTSLTSSSDGAALEYINNMFTYDAENQAIKANYSLYSVGDLSAYGLGSTTSGGTGGFTDEGFINFLTANGYSTSALTINYLVSGGTAAALDTLNELSTALGNDPNFATTVSNNIGTKWTQDDVKIANWDLAYSNNHTHANKNVLDGINATTVSNWDSAYTNMHTHLNKSVLDNLTDVNILNWNSAYTNTHTHTNKSVLDSLTDAKISNWDSAYTNTHTHSNKSVLDTLTVNNTNVLSHLSIVDGKLQIDIDTYSTGELSAYGIGSATGGTGVYDRLDLWNDYSVDKSGYVLSAYLGNDLNSRLSAIEGNGATTISTTGSGNAITSVSKTGTAITFNKNLNFSEVGHTHNYLPLSGGTLIYGGKIEGNGNITIRQISNGGNATGLWWKNIADTENIAGIGALTINGEIETLYLGWGTSPWLTSNSLSVSSIGLTYKNNTIWHAGNFNPSSYLPLSGGVLANNITNIISLYNNTGTDVSIGYQTNYDSKYLGFNNGVLKIAHTSDLSSGNIIWHAGNDGAGSGLDADMLDGKHNTYFLYRDGQLNVNNVDFNTVSYTSGYGITMQPMHVPNYTGIINNPFYNYGQIINFDGGTMFPFRMAFNYGDSSLWVQSAGYQAGTTYNYSGGSLWKKIAFTTDNVASATKLANTRTIWGQDFNGEGNVSGNLSGLSQIKFSTSAYPETYIWSNTNGLHLNCNSGSETALSISSTQNVRIGTAVDAGYKLDVNGTSRFSDTILAKNLIFNSNNTWGNLGSVLCTWGNNGGYPTLYGSSADRWMMHINPHISYVQNGVGGYTGSLNGSTIRFAGNTAANVAWDLGVGCNSVGSDKFSVGRSGSSFVSIDNTGNFGIGTTSPSYKLDVNGNTRVKGNLLATGEITAYSASDRRLKTDIQQLSSSLDIINKLNPVSYRWNDVAKSLNPNKNDGEDYGLIAQELEKVLPNLVHNVYDKYKSIDYVKLVPFLVASIKELHNKNIELERRIEKLSK